MDGSKSQTRRFCSHNPRSPWWTGGCKLQVGQSVAVCPGRGKAAIGRATILSVARGQLGDMTEADAMAEGFRDLDEFKLAWRTINGADFDADIAVWVIGLEPTATLLDEGGC